MIRRVALSLLLAAGALGLPAAPQALAAPPELQVVAATTYEVRPAARLIHVSIDGSATSYKPDSDGRTYYFPGARLVVLGGATAFSAYANGAPAAVTIVDREDRQVVLDIGFNRDLFYLQTTAFHLEFDLPSGSAEDVKVGTNVGAFPVWAVGTPETPGGSVTISIPPDFALDVAGDDLPTAEPRADGGELYRWTSITDPVEFGLYATADLEKITASTYREYATSANVTDQKIQVVVRAWRDDPDWGRRVSKHVTQALPILGDLIGVDYFGTRKLVVLETVSRSLDGYAGIFDNSQATDEIQVAFDADAAVTLHEAAHAWFNGSLATDRWILEGFAEHYGVAAAAELGIPAASFTLTRELRRSAFPLASWENPGLEEEDVEYYGYAASVKVAGLISDRAGSEGLTGVFRAMAADEAAYQPLHATEREVSYAHPGNWHYFLDLLEERTHHEFTDILRRWVVPGSDRPLLEARAAARQDYEELIDKLARWEMPVPIRRQMNAWAFDSAEASMSDAAGVLGLRTQLVVRADRLGVDVAMDGVETSFENGDYDPATATERQIGRALSAYQEAHDASEEPIGPFEWLGLVGEEPGDELVTAAARMADGDWQAATEAAQHARDTWRESSGGGQARAAVGAGAVLVVVGGGVLATLRVRRRRRRREDATTTLTA